ncbi:hypothetical protein SSX86_020593 [Deinandra increscens subsp. villosa]|uniref:RING-type domain-containing protein n=1 Tax=Deinandra increscens subsp. villosa TaxID=3103831 RepID=A0AAP0CV82_9ASTR
MAVQAHLSSDYYQNNTMGLSNVNQDWVLMSGSSVFGFGGENESLCFSYEGRQDQGVLDSQKVVKFGSDYHDAVSSSNSRGNGMIGLQDLFSEIEKQRLEMNYFLHFQNEKLKASINEETRKREMIIMQNYESKMKAIVNAKDEALNTANHRTKNLQTYLLMAEKEAKFWEKKAIETESMMTDLNRKLKQARARTHEDAESIICNGEDDDDRKERQEKMVCKMCHVRSTCVLVLPCRHLCCCRHCEGLLVFCPVCETLKNGSLEVFMGVN